MARRWDPSGNHDRHAPGGGSNLETVILFPGALGDLLLALPALRALRARHRDGAVTIVVNGWLVPILQLAHLGDAHVDLNAAATAGIFGGDAVPEWLVGRPRVYSWVGAADAEARVRLATWAESTSFFRVVRDEGPEHASAVYARQVGLVHDRGELALAARISPGWPGLGAEIVSRVPRPRLVLHAGAGAKRKCWAPEAFAAIAARWRQRGGGVVELVGPAERPAEHGAADLVIEQSLATVAGVLGRGEAYLGNDSGVSHLAAAVGARGVAVFGPTNPSRWGPLGSSIVSVVGGIPTPDGISAATLDIERVWCALTRPADLDNTSGPT